MPFAHGKGTSVILDAVNLSPYLNQADVQLDVDTADTTVFQAAWKSAIAGQGASKADLQGFYDPTELTMRNLIGADASLTGGLLTISPASIPPAIGDRAHLLSIVASSYAESSPVGGVIGLKWSVLGSNAAGMGLVLHPLAEDTNTTTGADRDDGAATSTGWTAHLHVIAVDAGSWVIKLQDAATLPTYADVSGGSFTAKTAAGSQRLVSASGATLRRFVRYVATRTGGSAGDGITFALAYSRNS
jgi:hypothetical protein